ncbi:putative reverse transcriptase domain-containing protein [Tanacetum coccineum]|uniref:Reverse transcriptase domain-containing protein n=1 Tax=Tanacetum coccineum TaxID=301880 RepID=A0ABQ5AVZ8_9ASTR
MWNTHVKTVCHDDAYGMPWKTLMKMMTDKYYPRNEIKKLEMEIWDLKDVSQESNKIEKYVGGLIDMIHGSVVASKPKIMQDAVEIKTELMDKKIHTFVERQTESKRNFEGTSRKTQNQQQQHNKRQNTGRAYTVRTDATSVIKSAIWPVTAGALQPLTMLTIRWALAKVYAVGHAGINLKSNVIMGTFLLNNCYAFIILENVAKKETEDKSEKKRLEDKMAPKKRTTRLNPKTTTTTPATTSVTNAQHDAMMNDYEEKTRGVTPVLQQLSSGHSRTCGTAHVIGTVGRYESCEIYQYALGTEYARLRCGCDRLAESRYRYNWNCVKTNGGMIKCVCELAHDMDSWSGVTENKRKQDNNQQQPQNKRQNIGEAYAVGTGEKKLYGGSKPLCPKCNYHHDGPCAPKCHKCNRVGHLARDCRSPANANTTNNKRGTGIGQKPTCYECGAQGHFKRECPKLKNNNNRGNPAGNFNASAKVYAIGHIGTNPDSNVVTGTFLLNNRYVSFLFDIGADRSFVSTAFSS